ncbi:MAG: TldD/PmbA family protein [Candidatus Aenigmarchaeota archaeon]|nr:TldD/PmbA family protein [Candidatus Aenigmarchaeota archaeon]
MIEKIARKFDSKVDQWEIFRERYIIESHRFLNKKKIKIKNGLEEGYGIRVIMGKHIGFATANSERELENAFRKAIKIAKLSDELNFIPELQASESITFEKIDETPVERGIKDLSNSLKAIHEKNTKLNITFSKTTIEKNIINSMGCNCLGIKTYFDFWVAATISYNSKHAEAYANFYSTKYQNVFYEKILEAISKARDTANAKEYSSFKLDEVVLHPEVFCALLTHAFLPSFYADAVDSGRSKLANKKNQRIINKTITIMENVRRRSYNYSKFDDEGNRIKRKYMVKNGMLKNYFYNSFYASKHRVKPTGNGFRTSYDKTPHIDYSRLEYRFDKAKRFSKMISEIKKGILVKEVLGAWLSNSTTGDFSSKLYLGYLIENGEITKPINARMVAGNIFDVLSGDFTTSKEYFLSGSPMNSGDWGKEEQILPYIRTKKIAIV